MKKNYKVFDKGFNKILDLIEEYCDDFYERYKSIIDIINENVLDAVNECEDFATGNKEYDVDFMRLVNKISLDYIRKKNYLRSEISIHRIFEEDLFKDGFECEIFSIEQRNTKQKLQNVQFYYEEKDGKYNFLGMSENSLCRIDLVMVDEEFYLICTENNGFRTEQRKIPISFDELCQFVENEDDYEEDMDIEFDADFDV